MSPFNQKVIEAALSYYGVREQRVGDNALINQWLAATTIPRDQIHDETSWCAAFLSAMLRAAGWGGRPMARAASFAEHGVEVSMVKAEMGDVVIMPNHVTLLIRIDRNVFWGLGGNQKNRVGIDAYPIGRFITARRFSPSEPQH